MAAVLFVCLGNICRSPAAEGMLRHFAEQVGYKDLVVDSCGIGDWFVGALSDQRITKAIHNRGVVLTGRAKQFQPTYLDVFDYILAADLEVLHALYQYAKVPAHKAKIQLITEFSESYKGEEIPDPYYGSEANFEYALDIIQDSCQGLLEHLMKSK